MSLDNKTQPPKDGKETEALISKVRKMGNNFWEDYRTKIDNGYIFQGNNDTKCVTGPLGNITDKGPCPGDVYLKMTRVIAFHNANNGPLILNEVQVKVGGNYYFRKWCYVLYNGVIFIGDASMLERPQKWFRKAGLASFELYYLYCNLSRDYVLGEW